jgi:hypothetical protein
MTTKYFNVKQGITTGNILLDGISGNITATNANLGNALTANYFIGNGIAISNIAGGNVSGQVGNALLAGTVYTNAQPNITSVGTLANLSVTGTITGGNLATAGYANVGTLTVSGVSDLGNVGNVIITGGTNGYYLQTNGSGNLVWAAISAGTSIVNGTSNVAIPTANGNVNITSAGNTTLVVTGTGANITGNFDVTGNLTAGNITTAGSSGNITGANNISANTFTSTITTGTAPFTVTSTTQVANLNVATAGTAGLAVAVTGAAQGNITSVGTLTGLNVNGTVTAVSFTANTGLFTGDGFGLSNIAGANITGTVANATYAVNANAASFAVIVTGNAQGNITSVGSLVSLTVTGNANVGNLGTTALVATGTGSFGGNITMNSFNIVSLATPVNDSDAATKGYVDSTAQGLDPKASVVYATTTSIFGSGYTYNNGTSGVGATITASSNGALSIDGSTPTVGERVLIKNEVGAFVDNTTQSAAFNGIYLVTVVGSGAAAFVLTRTTDFDVGTEMAGAFTFVEQGTYNADTGWVSIVNPPVTVGTTQIIWSQFSGAGSYTAGTGLTLTGTQFSISNTAVTAASYGGGDSVATFTVNQQGQLTAASNVSITANAANLTGTTLNATIVNSSLTSVGTLGNLSVTYDITTGNVYANSGTVKATTLTGTLTTNAQPNVTSVGTLTNLNVTGTVDGGNFTTTGYANVGSLNVTGTSNLGNVGNVTITGGTNGYYLQTNGSGALVWAAISAGTSIVNGNSNVAIPTTNGNVNITANGVTSLVVTGTGANVTGNLDVTGNISGLQLTSTVAIGTAPLVVTSTTQVANLNVATAGLAGEVTGNAQGNITSVGSLTGLTVSNATGIVNFTNTANVTLGAVGNLHISGGSANYVLSTDGSGGLSWVGVSTSSISNGTSNVNIPTANGNVNITAGGNTSFVVTDTGANIVGTFNATGNANVGNLGTAQVLASANVTAPQLISNIAVGTAPFIVTSTTQVANLNVATAGTAGLAVAVTGNAQGNITSVGTLTSLDVTGNITGGNITTAGTANVGTLIVTGATTFGNLTANYVALNGGLTSNRSNITVATNTVVDQFAPGTFRTAKYIISASGDDGFQSVETLLIHDGTTAYITIYGSICSNNTADIIELSSNINGISGNVSVYATGVSANLKVNMVSTYINT